MKTVLSILVIAFSTQTFANDPCTKEKAKSLSEKAVVAIIGLSSSTEGLKATAKVEADPNQAGNEEYKAVVKVTYTDAIGSQIYDVKVNGGCQVTKLELKESLEGLE